MPTVGVVIPAYNHAAYVGAAVESVLAQTDPPDEVIVVDDGSTDETPAVLARFGPPVRVLRQANSGVAAARNAGVAACGCDLIAFLDADDIWAPRKLQRQRERFLSDTNLGLVHVGVEDIDAAGNPIRVHLEGLEGAVAEEMLLFRRPVILGGGSGVMVPRAVLQAVGGFDTRLSTAADWDLYQRVAREYPVGFVREKLLCYRVHGGNMSRNVGAMERDMLLAYAKVFGGGGRALGPSRRRCYGRLHGMLAGSYLHAGEYSKALRHGARSVLLAPAGVGRLAGYPLRWVRRKLNPPGAA